MHSVESISSCETCSLQKDFCHYFTISLGKSLADFYVCKIFIQILAINIAKIIRNLAFLSVPSYCLECSLNLGLAALLFVCAYNFIQNYIRKSIFGVDKHLRID